MINQLGCLSSIFTWFKELGQVIIYCLIGLAIVIGFVFLAKNEHSRKYIPYIFAVIFIISGVFSGISLYNDFKSESYVVGSIDIHNQYSQEQFNYSSTSVVFYHDNTDETNTYYFEKELLKVDDFNGQTKTYQLLLNDFVLLDTEYNNGSIYSNFEVDFYDEYGELLNNSKMSISIKFLNSKTQLKLSTTGNTNAQYLEQYFSDYGIRLQVLELI